MYLPVMEFAPGFAVLNLGRNCYAHTYALGAKLFLLPEKETINLMVSKT
jgi:hypothetical protein